MDYLSRLLGELPDDPDFKYHPRCSKSRMTHLLFADDLLLFSYGSVRSVGGVMDCFLKFSRCVGWKKTLINVRFMWVVCLILSGMR